MVAVASPQKAKHDEQVHQLSFFVIKWHIYDLFFPLNTINISLVTIIVLIFDNSKLKQRFNNKKTLWPSLETKLARFVQETIRAVVSIRVTFSSYLVGMFADIKYGKKEFIPGAPRVSPERRLWVKRESAQILQRNLQARDKTKKKVDEERQKRLGILNKERKQRMDKWQNKTKTSPFAVDLVAEDERIHEENQIRLREQKETERKVEMRRAKAKNDIILKALSEFSDLEALRKEKRAIMEEEQRLRALLSLEKVTVDGKSDRLAAVRAARQRAEAKSQYRRDLYKQSLDFVTSEESLALRKKHNLPIDGSREFRV